jgi:hypothetical protein
VVAADAPGVLKRSVGHEIVELEGSGAEQTIRELQAATAVRFVSRTRRGCRLGIASPHEEITRIVGAARDITRIAVRPVTLEDVYFARTQQTPGVASVPAQ